MLLSHIISVGHIVSYYDVCNLLSYFFQVNFHWHGLTLMSAWICNGIHHKVWDEITYPFPNFNSATIEVGEWIYNLIPDFAGNVIIYAGISVNPCL